MTLRVFTRVTGRMKLPLIKTSAGATGLVWEIKSSVLDILSLSCVLAVVCW